MGTTSEKLTYLNGTKQLLKQKINNLGGSIDDNTTFRNYANQLQNVYDNLPKTEYQTGTEVNLGVTIKGKLDFENGVVGIGQSSQDTTNGYQLLDVPDIAEFTENGITLSAKDGTIYLKGTATSGFGYGIITDVGITTTGNSTLVRNGSDTTNSAISIYLTIGGTEYNGTNQSSHRDYRTFTATGTVTSFAIRVANGTVIDGTYELKPMLYLGDYDSTKEWEKFTGRYSCT